MKSKLEISSMLYDVDEKMRFETDTKALTALRAEKTVLLRAMFILELNASANELKTDLERATDYIKQMDCMSLKPSIKQLRAMYSIMTWPSAAVKYEYERKHFLPERRLDKKALELILS